MTQLIVNINQNNDLEKLLSVLKKMKVSYTTVEVKNSTEVINDTFLTVEKINEIYPNEWVLLAHTKKEKNKIIGGQVVAHHFDKREMAKAGSSLIGKYPAMTHFFSGILPAKGNIGLIKKISE